MFWTFVGVGRVFEGLPLNFVALFNGEGGRILAGSEIGSVNVTVFRFCFVLSCTFYCTFKTHHGLAVCRHKLASLNGRGQNLPFHSQTACHSFSSPASRATNISFPPCLAVLVFTLSLPSELCTSSSVSDSGQQRTSLPATSPSDIVVLQSPSFLLSCGALFVCFFSECIGVEVRRSLTAVDKKSSCLC